MSTALQEPEVKETPNYLNAEYGWKSWLFTKDHKRIAVLYLISISVMFALGGVFAMLIRLELLTPAGDLFNSDTYNKIFTMHGVTMIFFFLIPSIPATLGNFLVPMMIGAKDLAFPRINLLSWYIYIVGALFALAAIVMGGVDTGWTFYTPFSTTYSNTFVITAAVGVFIAGFSSIHDGAQLYRHDAQNARPRHDLGPFAALRLGQLRHVPDPGARHAGGGHHARAGGPGTGFPHRHFRSRPSAAIPFCSSTCSGSIPIRRSTS